MHRGGAIYGRSLIIGQIPVNALQKITWITGDMVYYRFLTVKDVVTVFS